MRFALCIPNALEFADPRVMAGLALDAERAGWDGFFLWDQIALSTDPSDPVPVIDPWVTLGAIAYSTERILIGTTVTPIARRRPAKLARETVTLDLLSHGRVVLGVGLGNPVLSDFARLGEDPDPHLRAEKLDQGLELLTRLWSGTAVEFDSAHYSVHETTFLPRPVQTPRIPIWVGGPPNGPVVRRSARWDGVFPAGRQWPEEVMTPDEYHELRVAIMARRTSPEPFDVALATNFSGDKPPRSTASIAAYEQAGVTWWMDESRSLADARRRINSGPH
jgi:alkanesulfonate monooxygenase SsuD/methylene tetrahydromethanopterin reductase-like flavin-dependent oxidoreductase (luciferase family)